MKKNSQDLDNLITLLLQTKDEEAMRNLFEGILTPKELLEIPTRLAIVRMLKKGIPQHQIAEKLGIGIATVTRGSKEIQKGNFKYI